MNREQLRDSDIAKVLPSAVRARLRAALEIDPGVAPGYSIDRTRELNRVTHEAKCQFPQYFSRNRFYT